MARPRGPKGPLPAPVSTTEHDLAAIDAAAEAEEQECRRRAGAQAEAWQVSTIETTFRQCIDEGDWLDPSRDRHGRENHGWLSEIVRRMRDYFATRPEAAVREHLDQRPAQLAERIAWRVCHLVLDGQDEKAVATLRDLASPGRWAAFGQAMEWLRGPMIRLVHGEPEATPVSARPNGTAPRTGEAVAVAEIIYTAPDTLNAWAKVYRCHRNTLAKRFKDKTYRTKRVGRLVAVAVDDLPASERPKHVSPAK
jgi:hypothetical protein